MISIRKFDCLKNTLSDLTIIVLTRNNEKTIEQCLSAIFSQPLEYYKIEVIVCDNGSIDKTVSIAKKYDIRFISLPNLNIPKLRNTAANSANSIFIGFVDSDCIIGENWVINALKTLENSKISITGYRYTLPRFSTWFQRVWYLNNGKGKNKEQLIPAGNLIVDKRDFFGINGFDETLETGEDAEFLDRARATGLSVVSNPKLINFHLGFPKNIGEFYKKEKWYGKGIKLSDLGRGRDKPTLGAVLFFISIVVFIISLLKAEFVCVLFSFFACFCLCLLAALHRKYLNGVGNNILIMTFIYMVYFSARINSILQFKIFEYALKRK